MNGVCRACHGAVTYVRSPNLNPRVLMQKAEPSSVDNNGTEVVLLTAYVYSPDDTISSVTVDLSPIHGSATQTMYDNGTNGDAVAGDKIYSYRTTVPATVNTGLKTLTITGTDSQSRTGTRDIDLMVANPGWTVVDNWDADFNGYWTTQPAETFIIGIQNIMRQGPALTPPSLPLFYRNPETIMSMHGGQHTATVLRMLRIRSITAVVLTRLGSING